MGVLFTNEMKIEEDPLQNVLDNAIAFDFIKAISSEDRNFSLFFKNPKEQSEQIFSLLNKEKENFNIEHILLLLENGHRQLAIDFLDSIKNQELSSFLPNPIKNFLFYIVKNQDIELLSLVAHNDIPSLELFSSKPSNVIGFLFRNNETQLLEVYAQKDNFPLFIIQELLYLRYQNKFEELEKKLYIIFNSQHKNNIDISLLIQEVDKYYQENLLLEEFDFINSPPFNSIDDFRRLKKGIIFFSESYEKQEFNTTGLLREVDLEYANKLYLYIKMNSQLNNDNIKQPLIKI